MPMRWPGGWLVATLTLAVLGACDVGGPGTSAPAAAIPDPPLDGLEAPVVEAIRAAREEVAARPDSATAWGRLGRVLHVHDLRQEALGCYAEAARLAPGEVRWPYLAARALAVDRPQEALEHFAAAAELGRRYAGVYLAYGDALLESGDASAAERRFGQALEIDPRSAHARFGLARAALLDDRLSAAAEELDRALAADAGLRQAHLLRAQVAQRLGDAETAQQHLWAADNHRSSKAPPDPLWEELVAAGVSATWAGRRGLANAEAGRYAEAEHEYRAALAAAGENARVLASLGAAVAAQGRIEDALTLYRRAIELDPREVDARTNFAQALLARGDLTGAEVQLAAALEAAPNDIEALLNLGLVRARQERFAEAEERTRAALEVAPGDLRALVQLGRIEIAVGRRSQAAETLAKALRIDPSRLDVLLERAQLLAGLGRHGEAIAELRRGLELAPNSSRLTLFLAWQLATAPSAEDRAGGEAVALARRVRRAYPRQAEAADVLAAALAESGDFAAAVEVGAEALRLAAGSPSEAAVASRLALYRDSRPFRSPG